MVLEERVRALVGEKIPKIHIEDNVMAVCPKCGHKKIKGPTLKEANQHAPERLVYKCAKCEYVQYVHTYDSKFLKSMCVKPT